MFRKMDEDEEERSEEEMTGAKSWKEEICRKKQLEEEVYEVELCSAQLGPLVRRPGTRAFVLGILIFS